MTETTAPKTNVFLSVKWLLIIIFTLLITIIMTGIFYWFYQFSTQQALNHVGQDLAQIVQIAALSVDGDELLAISQEAQPNAAGLAWQEAKSSETAMQSALAQSDTATTAGFSDDPRYQQLLQQMDTLHKIEPRAWPYIWVNDGSIGDAFYVVDLAAIYNPEKSTLFLESVQGGELTTELTLSTNEEGILESYTDDWGTWYSAWMPILDSNSQLIGGVGIDFEAGEVDQVQRTIRNTVLIVFLIIYLIVFIAIFWISKMITGPILKLTRAADAVGEGNYEQDFAPLHTNKLFRNEINILAYVFSKMVDKIQERVEVLQQQVIKLRVEIDEAKRQNQVEEIVNTDFFRDLKNRASKIRDQRNSSDPSTEE